MVDQEVVVYNTVALALIGEFGAGNIHIMNDITTESTVYPRVFFAQITNSMAERYQMNVREEAFADVMFEAQAYSNKKTGKQAEVRKIIGIIDDTLRGMGFIRIQNQALTNLPDPTIARRVARWEATISADGTIYRR